MPDLYTPYRTTEDGGIIDPPIIPRYERDLVDACALADDALIATITEDYHAARERVAKAHNDRVAQRQREDERLFAIDRQRVQQDAANAAKAQQEQARIADAERLRQQYGAQAIDPHGAGLIGGGENPTLPGAGAEPGAVNPDTYTGPTEPGPTLPGQGAVTDPGFVPPQRVDE